MVKEKLLIELTVTLVLIAAILLIYPRLSAISAKAQFEEGERLNRIRLFGRDDV